LNIYNFETPQVSPKISLAVFGNLRAVKVYVKELCKSQQKNKNAVIIVIIVIINIY